MEYNLLENNILEYLWSHPAVGTSECSNCSVLKKFHKTKVTYLDRVKSMILHNICTLLVQWLHVKNVTITIVN